MYILYASRYMRIENMRACVHASMNACIHAQMYVCMCVCVRARKCASTGLKILCNVLTHAYIHVHVHPIDIHIHSKYKHRLMWCLPGGNFIFDWCDVGPIASWWNPGNSFESVSLKVCNGKVWMCICVCLSMCVCVHIVRLLVGVMPGVQGLGRELLPVCDRQTST
jgi:hypothetical protein